MKTKPIGIRFDEQKLDLIKKREQLVSYQKVVDFLLDEYWKLFAPREVFQSKFSPSDRQEAKQNIAPPIPEATPYEEYYAELKYANSTSEIKATMSEAKADKSLVASEKNSLEKYANERANEINNN